MLNNMLSALKTAATELTKDRTLTLPQGLLNQHVSKVLKQGNVEDISLDIGNGHFDVRARVRKFGTYWVQTRFTIVAADISASRQVVTLQRVEATQISAASFVGAVLAKLAGLIPGKDLMDVVLARQPGIAVGRGGVIEVDLAMTSAAEVVTGQLGQYLKVAGSVVRVKELRCVAGAVEVVVGL